MEVSSFCSEYLEATFHEDVKSNTEWGQQTVLSAEIGELRDDHVEADKNLLKESFRF